MTMIESFVKERNDALFSLDRRKIEAYLIKYGEGETAKAPDLLFRASVYKAICGIKGAPRDVLDKAHTWLSRNGFSIPSYIGNLTTESTASRRNGRAETGPH